jgi:CRP-like cAMP-binding protein
MTTAPPAEAPRLVHLGEPGLWVGEGCFLSREPRRAEVRAFTDTLLMHLPLGAMEEMAARDPSATRRFSLIVMTTVDILVRIIHDLQKPQAAKRIASVLERFASIIGDAPIPLTQAELGALANASRKQVNAVLKELAAKGCVKKTYRSMQIADGAGLRAMAAEDA